MIDVIVVLLNFIVCLFGMNMRNVLIRRTLTRVRAISSLQRTATFIDSTAIGISQCATVLLNGGLVAFPTETVYGLGANALNSSSVASIFTAKQRPITDPLIVQFLEFV